MSPAGAGTAIELEATPESAALARRLIAQLLPAWECDDLVDDAMLCATELTSNATLHTREHFALTVRRIAEGVRIEVVDAQPATLPVVMPRHGTAADLAATALTGRGLHIIGTVAHRWGVTTSETNKSVWAELRVGTPLGWVEPIVVLTHEPEQSDDVVELHLLSLPVRTAVASGIHVEELVREVELRPAGVALDDAILERLYLLLDRSAGPRLIGRHAALGAAARGLLRFDLEFDTTHEALDAVGEFAHVLVDVSRRLPPRAASLGDDVVEFRRWLSHETGRQLRGESPRPCDLPS